MYAAASLVGHTQRPELWRLSADQGEFVFFSPVVRPEEGQASKIGPQTGQSKVVKPPQKLDSFPSQVQVPSLATPSQSPTKNPSSLEIDAEEVNQTLKLKESPEWKCEEGNGEVCFRLASQYVLGNKIPQNIEKGAGLLEKGCRTEHLDSCTALGTFALVRQRNYAR